MYRYHIAAIDYTDGMTIDIIYVADTEEEARDHMAMYWPQYTIVDFFAA